MCAKLSWIEALSLGLIGGVLASGCQTYDFEPVEPLAVSQTTVLANIQARNLKPNLMVLLDTSGSMTDPVNTSDPACTRNGTLCGGDVECPANCPTRWRELQGAMNSFLSTSGGVARMSLITYPQASGGSCGPSQSVRLGFPSNEDEASLKAHALQINSIIQGIPNFGPGQPEGGTPTSSSLSFVDTLPDLKGSERADFVLLLTDGLPNCNGSLNGNTCTCTLGGSCAGVPQGCLDKEASVQSVQALRSDGINTVVIGFGADTASGAGPEVLNAMAEAGGFARSCKTDADCGAGDTCNTTSELCGRRFYQARNQTELSAALKEIGDAIIVDDPCLVRLDADQRPSDPALIVIYMDGIRVESVENGTEAWELTPTGILFKNARCQQILDSTAANPVNIEVRAVQRR